MILFLTSSPTGNLGEDKTFPGFDTRNGFAYKLKSVWKEKARVLMITAFPDNSSANEEMKAFFHNVTLETGLSCSAFDLWDASTLSDERLHSKEALHSYDVIYLGGGHVPTQQQFFEKLNLRENIQGFDGIVLGISAGTMNCADIVYAQPEEPGEATNPEYKRFIPGLGLTEINILPHYQMTRNHVLDGLKLYDEITLPDSMGRQFLVLVDGSYVVVSDTARVYGESYLIKDGQMNLFCEQNQDKNL